MRDQFVKTATELLDERDDIAIVLAEISKALFRESGVLAAHPDRVINVGIREQLMVGVAAGMVFPARKFFRALSRVISVLRQAEPPSDDEWKFR